jgi:transglutaminase-like putative cysteine protease
MTQTQVHTQTAGPRLGGDRWRLQVVHRTTFAYSGPVRSSYNEARLTPENSPRQTTLRSRVEIEPAASAYAYRDYWGTTVTRSTCTFRTPSWSSPAPRSWKPARTCAWRTG